MLELIRAIREVIGPDRVLGTRLPSTELLGDEGNSDEECLEIARLAQEEGVNYISVTIGWHESPQAAFGRMYKSDQWLYLPALKRVKRISSADKSGPFMGSEFAYEDLSSQEVEKYRYRYLRDEILDGEQCFVVERVPVDENSGYTRQITWIDHSEYRMRRVEYYDRKGDLLKTMDLQNYDQYLQQYWRPGQLVMTNHQNGNRTVLAFGDYQFRTGLTEGDFTRGALSRVR